MLMIGKLERPPWALFPILFLTSLGCPGPTAPSPPTKPFQGVVLTVAVVDEPGLVGLVGAQRGEWMGSRDAVVQVREQPLSSPLDLRDIDVVLFPGDRMGDIIDTAGLVELPEEIVSPKSSNDSPTQDSMAFQEVFPAIRDQAIRQGRDRLALPIGGSVLVLVYRRDLLERPDVVKAAEEAGLKLTPPETWEELDALAKTLTCRDWDDDGQADFGIALALGRDPEGVGNATFLARAASLGQHPDHFSFLFDADTMKGRVASAPFVEALKALVSLRDAGPPEMSGFDANAAREAFRKGKAALLIDRAERAAEWVDPKGPTVAVGVAQLPGSRRVFEPGRQVWISNLDPPNRPTFLPYGGGWMIGVTGTTEGVRRQAALDFAAYLASAETAARTLDQRDLPMLAVRSGLVGRGLPDPTRAKGVDGRRWSDAVQKSMLAARVVIGPRLPGSEADMADLDAARARAAQGEDAEGALKVLDDAWDERTKSYGLERRKWHYRRGLNSLSAAPKAPPRADGSKEKAP